MTSNFFNTSIRRPLNSRQLGPEFRGLNVLRMTILGILCFSCLVSTGMSFDKMYWSDRQFDTIKRADLDGTNIETLVSGLGEARGVAVDWKNHRLYWADNGTNKIQRSMLDGSLVEDLVVDDLNFPAGITVDPDGGKIYWADAFKKRIQRADLDGSNVEEIVSGLGNPYFITIDTTNSHLYWTDYGTDKVQRSNLDGSHVVDLVTEGLALPRGIALDLTNQHVYWTDRQTDVIQRSDMNGNNIETLHNFSPSSSAVHGIDLDVQRNEMYWVDNGRVVLEKANLDGSNVTTILSRESGELGRPWQIVLDLRYDSVCPKGTGVCDNEMIAANIDAITRNILDGKSESQNDWNRDGSVNQDDRIFLVEFGLNTAFGDSNLDGRFASSDFVDIFRIGEYEDNVAQNSGWAAGDWNGDFEFTTSDLVFAFERNKYETATAFTQVPEPTCNTVFAMTMLIAFYRWRLNWPPYLMY